MTIYYSTIHQTSMFRIRSFKKIMRWLKNARSWDGVDGSIRGTKSNVNLLEEQINNIVFGELSHSYNFED
jgi:hypothetical protein